MIAPPHKDDNHEMHALSRLTTMDDELTRTEKKKFIYRILPKYTLYAMRF